MKLNKKSANIVFYILLLASVFITWKASGVAGDRAYSGEQPLLWVSFVAFILALTLAVIAILIRAKYGQK